MRRVPFLRRQIEQSSYLAFDIRKQREVPCIIRRTPGGTGRTKTGPALPRFQQADPFFLLLLFRTFSPSGFPGKSFCSNTTAASPEFSRKETDVSDSSPIGCNSSGIHSKRLNEFLFHLDPEFRHHFHDHIFIIRIRPSKASDFLLRPIPINKLIVLLSPFVSEPVESRAKYLQEPLAHLDDQIVLPRFIEFPKPSSSAN